MPGFGAGDGSAWDITELKSQWRGLYFDLYVMLGIFSRKVIRWEVHVTENADLVKRSSRTR